MQNGWAGSIRAEAEYLSDHDADGSSVAVTECRHRAMKGSGKPFVDISPGCKRSGLQLSETADGQPAIDVELPLTLRLERYTAQHVASARMTFVVDPIIPWRV